MKLSGDEIPGIGLADLSACERTLLWAFREIHAGRQRPQRLQRGFSTLTPAANAMRVACAAISLLRSIECGSHRPLALAQTPTWLLTYDEAALLALVGAALSDFDGIGVWLGRLGVAEATPALRDALATLAERLPQMRVTPIAGVNQRVKLHRDQLRSGIK